MTEVKQRRADNSFRTCTGSKSCGERKPLSAFRFVKDRSSWSLRCKDCNNKASSIARALKRAQNPLICVHTDGSCKGIIGKYKKGVMCSSHHLRFHVVPKRNRSPKPIEETKLCTGSESCGKTKALSAFNFTNGRHVNRRGRCKDCDRVRHAATEKRRKELQGVSRICMFEDATCSLQIFESSLRSNQFMCRSHWIRSAEDSGQNPAVNLIDDLDLMPFPSFTSEEVEVMIETVVDMPVSISMSKSAPRVHVGWLVATMVLIVYISACLRWPNGAIVPRSLLPGYSIQPSISKEETHD